MSDEENPVEEAPVEEHTQVANFLNQEILREVPAPVSIELGLSSLMHPRLCVLDKARFGRARGLPMTRNLADNEVLRKESSCV